MDKYVTVSVQVQNAPTFFDSMKNQKLVNMTFNLNI